MTAFAWPDGYQPFFVEDCGTGNEKILLIGEAPGEKEDRYVFTQTMRPLFKEIPSNVRGRKPIIVYDSDASRGHHYPFVGPSGAKLDEWWKPNNLTRDDFYITNVFPYRPPDNEFSEVPKDMIEKWVKVLHAKVSNMPNLTVIVPTGNTALRALTGKTGIADWRGSILSYLDGNGRTIKVIPALHPAGFFRQPSMAYWAQHDWKRIAGDASFPELRLFASHIEICPNKFRILDFVKQVKANPSLYLCEDIETDRRTGKLQCIGFSLSPDQVLVIPTNVEYWPKQEDRAWVIEIIRQLNALTNPKIFQNGLFDTWRLFKHYGIRVNNWIADTQAAHHCLEPTAPTSQKPHALDKMASIDCRTQFWKKDEEDGELRKQFMVKDWNEFYRYNGTDVAITHHLWTVYEQRLKDQGLWDLYTRCYTNMFNPLLSMSLRGVAIDDERRDQRLRETWLKLFELRAAVDTSAGMSVFGPKGISNKKLSAFLFEEPSDERPTSIGFKKIKGKLTDVIALKRIRDKYDKESKKLEERHAAGSKSKNYPKVVHWKRGIETIDKILDFRKLATMTTFLNKKLLDDDDRIRCTYKFTTEFTRLASSKNPTGHGRNLQNIPPAVKDLFIPDRGMVILEADLSQVESRIVNVLTGDPQLIEIAKSKPWEFDEHKFNAAKAFRIPEELITKDQRYIGKRIKHACVTGDHEVLTPFGWKRFDQLLDTDCVAQWDRATSAIEFVRPCNVHRVPYTGDIYTWAGTAFSQVTTPQHKMVYYTGNNSQQINTADYAATLIPKSRKFPVGGLYTAGYRVNNYPRLVVAAQADGSVVGQQTKFKFRKDRKVQRIKQLAEQYGIPYHINGPCKDGSIVVTLKILLPKHFGAYLLSWAANELDEFLDELTYWDGGHIESSNRREYYNSDLTDAGWVQTIAHMRGKEALLRVREVNYENKKRHAKRPSYTVSINQRQLAGDVTATKSTFTGTVYCVTVPSGFFLIRHNNTISISGNSNYDMSEYKMSDVLVKDGYFIAIEECARLMANIRHPSIEAWKRRTQIELITTRSLSNSWGRAFCFTYDDFSSDKTRNEVFRRGYACRPQSDAATHLNQLGLIPAWHYLRNRRGRLLLQVHDSLLMTVPVDELYELMVVLRTRLEQPRNYYGVELSIPVSFAVGPSWGEKTEWKKFPARDEVMETAQKALQRANEYYLRAA